MASGFPGTACSAACALGNAFKNVGHVWNGGDLQVGADPLNHPAMDHMQKSVETVQDIGSIRDNASRNTIQ